MQGISVPLRGVAKPKEMTEKEKKEKMMAQICLNCTKKKCKGSEECFLKMLDKME